jgi:hypothetical protein
LRESPNRRSLDRFLDNLVGRDERPGISHILIVILNFFETRLVKNRDLHGVVLVLVFVIGVFGDVTFTIDVQVGFIASQEGGKLREKTGVTIGGKRFI